MSVVHSSTLVCKRYLIYIGIFYLPICFSQIEIMLDENITELTKIESLNSYEIIQPFVYKNDILGNKLLHDFI